MAFKTADTELVDTDTLTQDTELAVTLSASTAYHFSGFILYTGGGASAPSIDVGFYGPAGATLRYLSIDSGNKPWGAQTALSPALGATATAETSTTTRKVLSIQGLITNGGTEGTFGFHWNPTTSSSTGVTLEANSVLIVEEIA